MPADFQTVDTWIFDLDKTLYPAHADLWGQIDARMKAYISDMLRVTPDEAFRIQKDYYRRYGTSLRGLMIEHALEPAAFLAHVHDVDLSGLDAAPRLAAAIEALPGIKIVYTNGSERHARNVLAKLGMDAHFTAVHDIVAAEFHPKPTAEAYTRFLDAHRVDPAHAAMFEDLPRNLEVPHRLGMVTVLVVAPDVEAPLADIPPAQAWESAGRDDAYIDHITEDLPAFLETLAGPRA